MTRTWTALLLIEAFLGVVILLYMAKYPLYPEYPSVDHIEHVRLSADLAGDLMRGTVPPLSQTVLYYGVEFWLAFAIIVTKLPAAFIVRYAMAFLAWLSPLVIYPCVKQILGSGRRAMAFTLLWALGGWTWFSMVFNTGFYPNFYGILSSLALAASVMWYVKRDQPVKSGAGVMGLAVVMLLLANAFFSHYTTLFVFPPLLLWLAVKARAPGPRAKAAISTTVLLAPEAVGLAFFPSIRTVLFSLTGLLSGGGGYGPSFPGLSDIMPLPILSAVVIEVTYDLGAVLLFIFAALAFLKLSHRRIGLNRDEAIVFPSAWFLTVVLFSLDSGQSAWRFAYVALVSLTMLAAHGLSSVPTSRAVRIGRKSSLEGNKRSIVVALALVLLLSGSWVFRPWSPEGALPDSLDSASRMASYQSQESSVFAWMDAHAASCGSYHNQTCSYLDLTDQTLGYSALLGGPPVEYDPSFSSSPESAGYRAATQGESFIIVSNVTSFQLPACQPSSLMVLSVKSYSPSSVQLIVHYFSEAQQNATVTLSVNGTAFASRELVNGSATATMSFSKRQTLDVSASIGYVVSNTIRIFAETDLAPQDLGLNPDFCWPGFWTSAQLGGAKVAFRTANITIWDVTR